MVKSNIENKINDMGLVLPEKMRIVIGVDLPFTWVRIIDNKAYISGHVPLNADGTLAMPLGKLGKELTVEQGYYAAQLTGLAVLSSLKRTIHNLDTIKSWIRVFGMVNTSDNFSQFPSVINGFSDLILNIFGNEIGQHSRSAIGVAGLPFNCPIEIEAEVLLDL